ncbi:MAG: NUDIX domain-containing protein, partial [Acidimicrobiia bacterium]
MSQADDRLPVSDEEPAGATAVVYRRTVRGPEFLMLHRAHRQNTRNGEWAWTPPAGARRAGEPVDDCARRELTEETGLELELQPTSCGTDDWPVYLAEAP